MLGLLGGIAVLASEMPRPYAGPLALASLTYGIRLARRESRRPTQAWVWPNEGAVTVDGAAVEDVELHWRGPLAFVRWRGTDGRLCRSSWWPDTLSAAARRELRLAAMARSPTRAIGSMAP